MGVLLLRPEDHYNLMSLAEGVKLMTGAFEEFARSPANLSNPRTRTNTPSGFRMTVHQGVSPSTRGGTTTARGEVVKMLESGHQKYPGRGRPVFVVYDTETAELLMIMVGEPTVKGLDNAYAMAGYQTACAAAAGTNLVARPNASCVGVLGSGGQAKFHLAALPATRAISEAVVYSPTSAHRQAFAAAMEKLLGFPIRPVDSSKAVIEFAEILLVCTNSNVPVLNGADLQPGTHVTSIVHSNKELLRAGLVPKMRQEIDDETLRRARLIVTTSKIQEELDQPEVLYGAAQRGVIRWEDIAEIGDVITGRVSVAEIHKDRGITFFKNPAGWGIGAGALFRGFHDKAREVGVGVEIGVDGLEQVY